MGSCFCTPSKTRESINAPEPIKINPIHYATNIKNIEEDYQIESVIGSGHFGTVRIGFYKPIPSRRVAIKSIDKSKFPHESEIEQLRRELEILQTVDHPNIINLYESFEDQKYIHIVTEFCEGGELFERVLTLGHFSEKDACRAMQAVLRAVENLHMNGICHRDLKPENFLFLTQDVNSELKLIDFGLSNKFGVEKFVGNMSTVVGTPYYVAPEVLCGPSYGPKCDLWSAGVIMYVLLCGDFPFTGHSQEEIFWKIETGVFKMEGEIWEKVGAEAKELVSKLIVLNPDKRLDAESALKHNWFSFLDDEVEIDPTILKTLRTYQAKSKLEEEALAVIVKYLSFEAIKELKEAFTKLDADNSGYLTFEEIEEALIAVGGESGNDDIRKIIENTNHKGDGRINYSEFLAATLTSKLELNEEIIRNAFEHFDIDKTGFITADNLWEVLKRAGKLLKYPDVVDMIEEVDLDEIDGKISYEEFKDMLLAKTDHGFI